MKDYKFVLKKIGELSSDEKEKIMRLSIKMYPAFKKYYLKNKYYSTVRPQLVNIIKSKENIVGTGKLLWRKIEINKKSAKLIAFGVLISKACQKKGLGTKVVLNNIKAAIKMKADILYGTTASPIAKKMMKKIGFKKIRTPIYYKDRETGKINKEKNSVYIFELKKGAIDKIKKLTRLYIGTGPL